MKAKKNYLSVLSLVLAITMVLGVALTAMQPARMETSRARLLKSQSSNGKSNIFVIICYYFATICYRKSVDLGTNSCYSIVTKQLQRLGPR